MTTIADREFFTVPEAAALLGCSTSHLYDQIRLGRRLVQPKHSIAPHLVKQIGGMMFVHRSIPMLEQRPENVSQFPIPESQIVAAMKTALAEFFAERAIAQTRKVG